MQQKIIECRHCGSLDWTDHECNRFNMDTIDILFEIDELDFLRHELIRIMRCRTCGQLWKYYYWKSNDHAQTLWLKPGESEGVFNFKNAEANQYIAKDTIDIKAEPLKDKYTFGFKNITINNCLDSDFLFGGPGPRGKMQSIPIQYWADQILTPKLNDCVPQEIIATYEVARGSLVYGFFFYPLCTLATEQLFRVAEGATREKCIQLCAPAGAIKHFNSQVNWLLSKGYIDRNDEILWKGIRELRNKTSHPKQQNVILPLMVVDTLNTITNAINKLFN